MTGNLLNIGKSGLYAAQLGLATTGHNIANASVAGYSRQVVVQASNIAQDFGYGFVGTGTNVADIKRYSDNFLNTQVRTAQATTSAFDSFYTQISQVDNLLADNSSGLSPALQDFFKGVQDLAANPASTASRQAMLSSAESLASRFQGMAGRLQEIADGVSSQITSNVTVINSYAAQIAKLNQEISSYGPLEQRKPNDLLDARDQLIAELNEKVRTTVTVGDNNSLNISIGNGLPLVVGNKPFQLAAIPSPTDPARIQVGYVTGSKVTVLADNALGGGELGGLMEFRSSSLDRAQNSLGRVAIAIAETFNAQHRLGIDSAGDMGGDFFKLGNASVTASTKNALSSTMEVTAAITDVSKLTQSDYRIRYDGANFTVTRLSDNTATVINPYPQTVPQEIDGIAFAITGDAAGGAATAGDTFLVRPTINGAAQFSVGLSDRTRIAAGAPISTSAPLTNVGTGKLSPGSVDADYLIPGNEITTPVTLTYSSVAPASLSGFPPTQDVTVTAGGVTTVYPAGTADIPYAADAKYSFGGVSVSFTGAPANGDTFEIAKNSNGVGDNRNALLLGGLQAKNVMDGGTATYQSSYAEMVSFIGNKTREVEVSGKASAALLAQSRDAQQDVSGVNLDEEAANLLKYQQAYQASGKVMQIAGTLFDTLLSIGR